MFPHCLLKLYMRLAKAIIGPGNVLSLMLKPYKKKVSRAKKRLNSEFVEKMTPDLLKDIDPKDEVIGLAPGD